MNLKIWIPLSAAVITGGAAAYLGMGMLTTPRVPMPVVEVKFEELVIAARALPAGSRLKATDLRIVRVEAGSAAGQQSAPSSQLTDRVLAVPIVKGQPMTEELLAHPDALPGLSAILPVGHRAITIQANRYDGLDGFLQPDVHVDILATLRESGGGMIVRTVVQNVRVLAINGLLSGQERDDGDQKIAIRDDISVTLLVTPEQAAAIDLAAENGNPRLALRPGGDHEISPFLGMTLADLRGDSVTNLLETIDPFTAQGDRAPRPTEQPVSVTWPPVAATDEPAPSRRRHTVEIIRGGVISHEQVVADQNDHPPRPPRASHAVVNSDPRPIDR